MASVASKLIEEVTAHAQSDSLEDAREICAGGTYFPNNLRTYCFYTAKKVTPALLNVTLYVHYTACLVKLQITNYKHLKLFFTRHIAAKCCEQSRGLNSKFSSS